MKTSIIRFNNTTGIARCVFFLLVLWQLVNMKATAQDLWQQTNNHDRGHTNTLAINSKGCDFTVTGNASANIAYIFTKNPVWGNDFGSLLASYDFKTDLIEINNVSSTNFSNYNLIIIDSRTSSGYKWGTSAAVSTIRNAKKPILGLGFGGAGLFQEMGLSINWGHGWVNSDTSSTFFNSTHILCVDASMIIFNSPNQISIPRNSIIQLYSYSGHLGLYAPHLSGEIELIGREPHDSTHYSIVSQDKVNWLWGFTNSPSSMTKTGKNLFINIVTYLIQRTISTPTVSTNEATNITSTSAKLNATINANNSSTTAKFEYGITTNYGREIPATPGIVTGTGEVTVSAQLTDLIPNTTYHFRVVATNIRGTTTGEDKIFTTAIETTPPSLDSLSYPEIVNENTEVTVSVNITDDTGIEAVILYYRIGGTANFFSGGMLFQNNNKYAATILADLFNSKGVEFYIWAEDKFGNVNQTDIYPIQVSVIGDGVSKTSSLPGGSAQTAYRLISFPLNLEDKIPNAVLEDDLGTYDNSNWRFFELRSDQQYYEFQNISAINPGEGFWLIVKDAGKTIDTGPGTSIPTNEKYPIALNPGWTFVGNPFNFPIPFNKLSLKSEQSLDVRSYDGLWTDATLHIQPFEFLPFEGYAVANYNSSMDTLFVDPYLFPVSATMPKAVIFKSETNYLWYIKILAQCSQARDVDNIATVVSEADCGVDELDRAEPPVIGEYVSVYFPHPEWDTPFKHYSTDARPEPLTGEIWKFEVRTNIRDKVDLTFEGLENVPSNLEVLLLDEALKISANLRQSNSYSFTSADFPKRLKLVVGSQEFVEERLGESELTPASFELSQNFPNPFNPVTTIRYGLPQAGKVTLTVYNLMGEVVVTLVNEEQMASGYHVSIWDGRNQQGQQVTSGIYIYQLRAGSYSVKKKMTFMK